MRLQFQIGLLLQGLMQVPCRKLHQSGVRLKTKGNGMVTFGYVNGIELRIFWVLVQGTGQFGLLIFAVEKS